MHGSMENTRGESGRITSSSLRLQDEAGRGIHESKSFAASQTAFH